MSKDKTEPGMVDETVISDIDLNESKELEDVSLYLQEIQALKDELENVEAKTKSEYIKAYADMENLKKRLQRESEAQRKYRIQSFATSILPVIDNLERALASSDEDNALKEGVKMIYDQLMASLINEGVEAIDALNQPFDPNIHQAVVMEAVEGVEPGLVIEELQKGYMLKDRILRASMVKVSQ